MVKPAVVLVAAIGSSALVFGSGPRALDDDASVCVQAETAALQAYFKITPTDEDMDAELRRLASEIGPQGRLQALYEALGDDPVLIRECLARPALVERKSRERYAFDPSLHAATRAEALDLRRRLVSSELSPGEDYPGRTVFELTRSRNEGVGRVSGIAEERDGFVLSVVLSEKSGKVRVAKYVVPKVTFDEWRGKDTAVAASGPDLYSFCAIEGAGIDLRVDGNLTDPTSLASPSAALLDAAGESVPTAGDGFRAPYTGAYFAQVLRGASPNRDDYLLSIDVDGRALAREVADLSVTATVQPDPVETGGLVTYAILMHNAGPDIAADAEMLEWLPAATTFESITVPQADGSWECPVPRVGGRGKISCTSKCFGPGDSATFMITVRVDPCLGNTQLTGTASASSASIEPNPGNNTAIETSTVVDTGVCNDENICTVGDHCGPGIGFQESFDGVAAPFLPAGWRTTLVIGPLGARPWRTVAANPHTEPNSVFTPDAGEIRDSVLDSPPIPIVSAHAQLRFQNRYDFELAQDGGVLEISIGGGDFLDIEAAGGTFTEGAYNGTISEDFGSPIGGRFAWTGRTPTFVPTTVNLPPGVAGQSVVLRWRVATDRGLGAVGQWIDTVSVTGSDACLPGAQVGCDDNDPCTADVCDPVAGCGHVRLSCDDGNACTDDACDAILQCVHTDNSAPCDDHNACTSTDVCAAGACVGSTAVTCHDDDVCTANACDPTLRCLATTADFDAAGFSAGRVDGRDLAILAGAWNSCPGSPRYNAAANLDRQVACVNASDFHLFMDAFGHDCAP